MSGTRRVSGFSERIAQDGRVAGLVRYIASLAGVALVTWLISLISHQYHIANISMVYLLLVLALAVFAGSGPAILASVVAFLAFDWFFIPPVGRITVSDPDEWLALFLFLVVAIITGQLAAGLRHRAEEARGRAREITTLYELSTAILGDTRLDHILSVIAERLLLTLGLRNVAILLARPDGTLDVAAEAGEALASGECEDREANAHWAIMSGAATGRFAAQGPIRLTRPVELERDAQRSDGSILLNTCVPIVLGGQSLGAIAALGEPDTRRVRDERIRLLHAFAAQIALAVSRARLVQEEERARAAAQSERMKSVFLASVSHDLRTPLTAIKTAAAALRRNGKPDAGHAEPDLIGSIDQEVDRLDRLVENLLEMSRIESGGLPLRKAPEDVAEILGTAVHRLAPLLAGRELSVAIADDLPLVALDAVQIDRVLVNLIENAVKFSPPGSEIRLQVRLHDDRIYLRIHNAGPGLDERERIFDKFYRLQSGNGVRGTGLGLAICKGIVEAHEGRIWAENDVDGVSFVVALPVELPKDGVTPVVAGARVAG